MINEALIGVLINRWEICEEDIEIYKYGIKILEKKILFILLYYAINIWCGNVMCGTITLICFIIMRRNMGGLHLKNAHVCFIVSVISLMICSAMARYNLVNDNVYRILYIIANIILIIIGPVDCENKRVCYEEKKYYYKMGIITMAIIGMVLMFTVFMKWEEIEKSIEGSFILIGVSSCIAKLKHG